MPPYKICMKPPTVKLHQIHHVIPKKKHSSTPQNALTPKINSITLSTEILTDIFIIKWQYSWKKLENDDRSILNNFKIWMNYDVLSLKIYVQIIYYLETYQKIWNIELKVICANHLRSRKIQNKYGTLRLKIYVQIISDLKFTFALTTLKKVTEI